VENSLCPPMNGHRQSGPTGPFRVRFYPRRIIANKAAGNDSSNFLGSFSNGEIGFFGSTAGGMGAGLLCWPVSA
jgi:hypothetical protein